MAAAEERGTCQHREQNGSLRHDEQYDGRGEVLETAARRGMDDLRGEPADDEREGVRDQSGEGGRDKLTSVEFGHLRTLAQVPRVR